VDHSLLCGRNSVPYGEEVLTIGGVETLRVNELGSKFYGNEEGHEGSFDERTADSVEAMLRQPLRQFGDKRPNPFWMQAQQLQVQPQITVVSRLQEKVPLSNMDEFHEFLVHTAIRSGVVGLDVDSAKRG
jgi:hypothetical protein